MTPLVFGMTAFAVPLPNTLFIARIGTSSTVTPVATTNQQVGVAYGLTKDTGNNFWYVDTNKTGASAAVRVVALSPLEAVGTVGGHVIFEVLNAVAQLFG
jgi:NAD-dependent SIR2 family protein deacetylase